MRELQMQRLHQRKLRSDKYKPPTCRLLEFYESDSSVEADEDTDAEAGADPGAVVEKSQRRTRSAVMKKSASAVAAAISAVKTAEQKKKKWKRKAASPPAVVTPSIPTPRSREVESKEEEDKDEAVEDLPVPEDQEARRLESPTTKRHRELVQKTLEDALRRGLEARCSAAAAQVRMPTTIKPRVFWLKTRLPVVMR
jgi:hypothetical protein